MKSPQRYLLWSSIYLRAIAGALKFDSPTITGIEAEVGSNFQIAWEEASGFVTLSLVTASHSESYGILGSELTTGQYTWFPDAYLAGSSYSIRAGDNSGTYYSVSFGLTNNTSGVSPTSQVSTTPQLPSTTANSVSTQRGLPQTTAPVTSSPAALPTQGGLTTGAKAGIGVGASIAGLGLIILGAIFFFRQGKRSAWRNSNTTMYSEQLDKAELGPGETRDHMITTEDMQEGNVERERVANGASELEGIELHSPAELDNER